MGFSNIREGMGKVQSIFHLISYAYFANIVTLILEHISV